NRLGEDVVLPCRISERHNAVRFSTSERNVEQSRGLIFFCLIRATDRVEVPQSVLQRVVAFEYARQIPQRSEERRVGGDSRYGGTVLRWDKKEQRENMHSSTAQKVRHRTMT